MDERTKLILSEIKSTDHILDVGCVGHVAESMNNINWLHGLLHEKYPNLLGIDIESDEIKKLADMGYNVLAANCETMNLGMTFDVIVAGEIIEHLSNPGLFFDGVRRHLKPGGKFILSVPNAYCYYNILSAVFRSKVPVHGQHTCWYDKTTIKQLLEQNHFQIQKFNFLPIPSTGRGRWLSLMLYYFGFVEIAAAGFFIVCKAD